MARSRMGQFPEPLNVLTFETLGVDSGTIPFLTPAQRCLVTPEGKRYGTSTS